MTNLGDHSLDLPYENGPPGQDMPLDPATLLAGGVVAMAVTVPLDDTFKPGLLFRFTAPTGEFYQPILLVLDDDQAVKTPPMIRAAVAASVAAAREAIIRKARGQ